MKPRCALNGKHLNTLPDVPTANRIKEIYRPKNMIFDVHRNLKLKAPFERPLLSLQILPWADGGPL